MSNNIWPIKSDDFQILNPIQTKKGEMTVGHISSNVSNNLLEEELEWLKKRIKELEKELNSRKKVVELNEDDEEEDFFEQLNKSNERQNKNGKHSGKKD